MSKKQIDKLSREDKPIRLARHISYMLILSSTQKRSLGKIDGNMKSITDKVTGEHAVEYDNGLATLQKLSQARLFLATKLS